MTEPDSRTVQEVLSPSFRMRLAIELAKNLVMKSPTLRAMRLRMAPRTSAAGAGRSADDLQRYALALPKLVLSVVESLDGKSVAEIGPGDHLATGLVMLAAGAAEYTCLDRFPGHYGNAYAKGWYRAVRDAWHQQFPERAWPAWLDPDRFPEAYPDRVHVVTAGVEQASELPSCDIVCSHAVGEHVLDVGAFARTTRRLLKADGVAIHLVDFSQHYEWARYGDRYLFLALSDRLWDWIGSARGSENRVRYAEFKSLLEAAGMEVSTVSRRYAEFDPAPERLLPRFRSMPLDSLRTLEATFVCKPLPEPRPGRT